MKHLMGIDAGEETHQICVLTGDGRVISEFDMEYTWAGLMQLTATLDTLPNVEINLEQPNGLLVDWLLGQNRAVFVTPPSVVAHRRPRQSKDDRGDAYLLAYLRYVGDPDSRPIPVQSEHGEELRQLTQAFDQLQQQQKRMASQLRDVLKRYYPVATGLFSSLSQPLTLAFLRAFPTPQAAQAASLDDLYTFFQAQSYRYMYKVPDFYHQLQQPILQARVQQGSLAHMLALVAVLEPLGQELKAVKCQQQACFKAHPEANWWLSLPGVGPLTASRLLARIGDNRERFPSYQSLQAVAGTVPVTRQSGKKTVVSFRKACSRPLRRAFMDLARHSIRKSGWARSYFYDQRARGHDASRAYRALANRWAKIVWTIWQRREPYDEALHVANRSRRGVAASAPTTVSFIATGA